MAYLRFLEGSEVYEGTVIPEGNVVTLKFSNDKKVSTSGFDLFLDKECEVDIGGETYRGYRTIYRNDEETEKYNGFQLSNDGSVYVEPIIPDPVEPTLDEVKEQKIQEMNDAQQDTIHQGVDVTLSDGTVEHFALTENDQISLMGLQTQVVQGVERIPWHNSDSAENCKYYSNYDMGLITKKAMEFVTYHVTYFRDLRIYINSMETKERVENVVYGDGIPVQYQSQVLKDMIAAQLQ